jgi:hypothetical protein
MNSEILVKEEFVTLTDLKDDYRLSPKWIERLGPPDKEKRNPHYRCAAPMKLWRKCRVEEFCRIQGEEYEKRRAASEKRAITAHDIAARKRKQTLEYAGTVPIELWAFPKNLRKACFDHLQYRAFERDWDDYFPKVTLRTIVNMLRHEYTSYHRLLNSLFRRVGRWDAYPIIKDRVNTAICERIGVPVTDEISRDSDVDFVKDRWGEEQAIE